MKHSQFSVLIRNTYPFDICDGVGVAHNQSIVQLGLCAPARLVDGAAHLGVRVVGTEQDLEEVPGGLLQVVGL